MNDEQKKRLQEALASGQITEDQAAKMLGGTTTPTPTPVTQKSGIAVDSAVQNPQQKDGIVKGLVRAVVQPGVDYLNMAGGAVYEGSRAIKSAMGDKNAYVDKNGAVVQNPFLKEEELKKFSDPASGMLEGAKRTAGMEAYFIPAGKVAEGAGIAARVGAGAVQGAKIGGLTGFSQSDATDVAGLVTDSATGALKGGVTGGVLSAAGEALNKMKGAKNAAAKNIVDPQVAPTPNAIANKDKIIQGLDDMGINTGSAEDRMRGVGEKYKAIQTDVNKIAEASGGTRDVKRLAYNLKTSLTDSSDHFIPGDATYEKVFDREMKLLEKKSVNGVLKTTDLVAFKNDLASKLGRAFKIVNGESSAAMTPIEGVRMDLWNQMDDLITKTEPKLKELTLQQSILHQASPGLLKNAEKVSEIKPFGVPTGININGATQNLRDKGGRLISAVGGVGDMVPGVVSKYAPVGIDMAASTDQPQPQTKPSGISVSSATMQTQPVMPDAVNKKVDYVTGYSPEQLDAARVEAIKANDKAAVTKLTQLHDIEVEHQKTVGGAGGKGAAMLDNAQTNIDLMERLYKLDSQGNANDLSLGDSSVGFGGAVARGQRVAQKLTDQEYVDRLNSYKNMTSFAAGILNQARGAGVLNAGEYEVMLANMPNENSTRTQADNWFSNMRGVLSMMNGAGVGSSTSTTASQ
jgi:hypothetical protein